MILIIYSQNSELSESVRGEGTIEKNYFNYFICDDGYDHAHIRRCPGLCSRSN